ncbi:MAG: KH domain-containing protein [Acidimicrobiia bacterium]
MSESIVHDVVHFVVSEIAEKQDEVKVTIVDNGEGEVIAEVEASKSDMGRVIGRRGRVAKAIRTLAQAAADEEGLHAEVEFAD